VANLQAECLLDLSAKTCVAKRRAGLQTGTRITHCSASG